MAQELGILLQDLLRPSERVKLALSVVDPPKFESASGAHQPPPPQANKLLALVCHADIRDGTETGCLMICRQKNGHSQPSPEDLVLEHIFPIYGDFSISIAQPLRNPSDPRQLPAPATDIKTELTLTIKPGDSFPLESVSLLTTNTQGLRSVLTETNRLIRSHDDLDNAFAWLAPYTPHGGKIPFLSPVPPDLRYLTRPLHTLLSRASAGVPGDEAADVDLIREDWLRNQIQHDFVARCEENVSLRIRIGTFNVNGKFPSQDLSAWVAGRTDIPPLIPPLKGISPLSLGELSHDEVVAPDDTSSNETESIGPSLPDSSTVTDGAAEAKSTSSNSALSSVSTVAVPPSDVKEAPTDADVLVLAFQELDLSAGALLYSSETAREDAWCVAAFAGLGEKAVLYEKLASKQLVGMLLVIIVKKRLKDCFGNISSASVGAGIMGIMGNKGATALRLSFTPGNHGRGQSPPRPTVFTFVNSHLAAFDEMYEKRNADFHEISKRLSFDSGIPVEDSAFSEGPANIQLSVYDTDVLFWMGDLNYRLNLPDTDIRSLLRSKFRQYNLRELLRFDQLGLAMRDKKAFEGFVEFPITHSPSYRFNSRAMADSLGYDMKRKPAWTDRILHICSPGVSLEQLAYRSHPEISMSDHRPVSADFEARLPVVDSASYGEYVRSQWKNVVNLEHTEEAPKMQVVHGTIDFGRISHKRRVERIVSLKNTGKTAPCVFRFVPAIWGAAIHPEWISINKMTGLIEPGGMVDITLVAYVDDLQAAIMNTKNTRLDDTLILHTALGKDHFISISGEYERTCFANSLEWLTRLPCPVRELKSPEDLLPEDDATNAPKEIMRLINWLMSHVDDAGSLFVQEAEEALVGVVREALDSGGDFPDIGTRGVGQLALAVGHCLLQLLDSLTESIIPVSLHARCSRVASRDEAFELLSELPSAAVNVWISVTAFLHYIIQSSPHEKSEELVAIFTPVLLRDEALGTNPVSVLGKRKFLRYFIE